MISDPGAVFGVILHHVTPRPASWDSAVDMT
jgi:hypothetical protein